MEKVIDRRQFQEYYRKNRFSIGIAVVFLVVAYGIKIFQIAFSHDTEAIISVPESLYDSWMTMGRFGLILLKKIFGIYTFNPYLASMLMFLTMVAGVIVWGYLFYVLTSNKMWYAKASWILPVIFFTTPMMAEQISFLLQAFEVSFSVMLLGCALIMMWHAIIAGKYLWHIPAFFVSALVFSVYQTTVPLFVTAAAAGFIVYYQKREKSWWTVLLQLVGSFGVSFLIYEGANKVIMKVQGISTTSYISDQLMWTTLPAEKCIDNILKHIGDVLTGEGFYYSVSFGIACTLGILFLVLRWKKSLKEYYLYCIANVVFIFTPFLMTVLMGQEPKMRTQLGIGFVTGFYLQYTVIWFGTAGKKIQRAAGNVILCVALLFCFQQASKTADMFYTEYLQYQEDVRLALKISDRIDMLNLGEQPQEPVVFVGARIPQLNESGIRDLENIGHSFFEWSFTTGYGSFIMRNFMSSIGYQYNSPTEAQIQIAEKAAGDMGIWPSESSVQLVEGVIVVRLS